MSFLDRAKNAAGQMADQARQTVEQVTDRAGDPAAQERMRLRVSGGMRLAGRRMRTVVERIDPATLADLIIKATAVQELTNRALRERGSPYRIAEITVAATIPPGVNFTIGRVAEGETPADSRSSTELLADAPAEEAILSLGGSSEIAELAEPAGTGDDPAVTSA
jgi:peptidoglycan hydrolase-like protein with peptidoglycan-binding domain